MDFAKDGRRFQIAPEVNLWRWSVTDMADRALCSGLETSRALAAARVVAVTLAEVRWPAETGMTRRLRAPVGKAA